MHTAIIVSNDFHQERAQLNARDQGIQKSGYGGHSQYLNNARETLREVLDYAKKTFVMSTKESRSALLQ
jgi:vancomycin permeability regulator SanA